ncbi:MAG: BamA/TamA family outer membrane protein [Saprospiraceae bacterium]
MLCMLSSCVTRVPLKENEKLLKKNRIILKGFGSDGNKNLALKSELLTLFKQRPNRKWLLLIKREKIYSFLEHRKNKKILFKKTLQKIAEPPSILSQALIQDTKSNMYNYMFNKGYFDVEVNHKIKSSKTKAVVSYTISPKKRYIIDNFAYQCEDTVIQKILISNLKDAYIKKGKPLDNFEFQKEKSRITELLNNLGFAEFNPIYIQNLDTDTTNNKVIVVMHIINPDQKSSHTQFKVNKVQVFTDYNPNIQKPLSLSIIDSVYFLNTNTDFYIKNSLIAKKILFRSGNVFSKRQIDSTYNKLSNLEFYKFINIETKLDSFIPDRVNHNIYLTPNNKWLYDIGADLNYTSLRTNAITSSSLFGISSFALLKNRNAFHRGEILDSKIEVGTELNFFSTSLFNAVNINFSNGYHLPVFHDITGTYQISKYLFKPFNVHFQRPDVKTSFNLGIEWVSLINLFNYVSVNNSISYNIQLGKTKRLVLSTFDFSLYIPQAYSDFDSILNKNAFLKLSFTGTRLFTSFFLSHLQFYHQQQISPKWSKSFSAALETSGLEVSLIDGLSNLIFNKGLADLSSIKFSKFIKMEADHRWYYTFRDKNSMAFKINYGIAVPFGKNKSIPYIKQFSLGGPQSLRAWRLREPGPGASKISLFAKDNSSYYSAGDIKFETNIEYRFKIYWRFEGAIFTDIGNIWLLPNNNLEDKSGVISKDAYKQIAAGSGFGLRLDFGYFLLRLDYGMKWRNPFPDDSGNYGIYTKNKVNPKIIYDNSSLHLALNYPF